jgi:hypothetical protein
LNPPPSFLLGDMLEHSHNHATVGQWLFEVVITDDMATHQKGIGSITEYSYVLVYFIRVKSSCKVSVGIQREGLEQVSPRYMLDGRRVVLDEGQHSQIEVIAWHLSERRLPSFIPWHCIGIYGNSQ